MFSRNTQLTQINIYKHFPNLTHFLCSQDIYMLKRPHPQRAVNTRAAVDISISPHSLGLARECNWGDRRLQNRLVFQLQGNFRVSDGARLYRPRPAVRCGRRSATNLFATQEASLVVALQSCVIVPGAKWVRLWQCRIHLHCSRQLKAKRLSPAQT